MPEEPLNDILGAVRDRLQQEIEGQFRALAQRHDEALATARREIEASAEQRWSALLNQARLDAQQSVESAVVAARAEALSDFAAELDKVKAEAAAAVERVASEAAARAKEEAERQLAQAHGDAEQTIAAVKAEAAQQLAAETARVRNEVEQRASETLARTRQELEQALAAERQSAQERVDAERRHAAEQLELARDTYEASMPLPGANVAAAPLLDAFRQVDEAQSVSDTLAALVRAGASTAGRAALFVANGPQVDEWVVAGVPTPSRAASTSPGAATDIVAQALTSRAPVRASDGASVAAPLVLDGAPVGVLYGERNGHDSDEWVGAIEAIARYGSAHLGYLTALRTAQARQWIRSAGATNTSRATSEDQEAASRRYARLLVSEIKLYNEAAVREGCAQRDLLRRLGPEIDRARRLFEERVPPAVARREQHFHDELVQTLAGGDPALLG